MSLNTTSDNGVTSTQLDLEAVVLAAIVRMSALSTEQCLHRWQLRQLLESGAPKSEVAAAERKAADLATEIETRQLELSELRTRVVQEKMARLETDAKDLRRRTDAAYEAIKVALADAERHEINSEKRRIELLNNKNATKASWNNLSLERARCKGPDVAADLERKAPALLKTLETATKGLETHEVVVGETRRELALRVTDANNTWDQLRSQCFQANHRLEDFKRDPSVIAVLRVKSRT